MLWNRDAEAMDREQLRALQAERLRDRVRYVAERVPFYRAASPRTASSPAISRRSMISRGCPSRRKAICGTTIPFGLFAVPQSEIVRLHASSGTKGKLTVVGYTRRDLGIWAEVCARALALGGGTARKCRPQRVRIRPLYGWPRHARRRRTDGRDRCADERRQHAHAR